LVRKWVKAVQGFSMKSHFLHQSVYTRVYKKVSGLSRQRNIHSLRSNIKGYGGKTHETDSQNSDTTEPSGREL
jgi:hypothetical protein